MSHAVEISIIVVNRNTKELLRECLEAVVSQQEPPSMEIIVVDNGSSDGSVEMVRDAFPGVRLLANPDNVGYAQANNQGVAASQGRFVMLINSDAVLSPRALRGLAEFMFAAPGVGAAGVRLLNTDGSLQRLQRGRALTLGTTFNQMLLVSTAFPRVKPCQGFHVETDFDRPEQIGWVSTACGLFRSEALEAVGPMDESLVTYGTDLDLCQRIVRAGWLVYSLPIDVVHHGGASFPDTVRSTMWFRSLHLLFARDHSALATRMFDLLIALGFALRSAAHLAVACIGRQPQRRDRARAARETARAAAASAFAPRPHREAPA